MISLRAASESPSALDVSSHVQMVEGGRDGSEV